MSFHQWDATTAPTLRIVAELAKQCNSRAAQICLAVHDLPARPAWITKAEAELQAAEQELAQAAELIRAAREAYRKTAVMAEVVNAS